MFHPDSYGYRPRRGALDAVQACRRRCWKYNWVIDLDVRKFFDSVPWDLIVKAVQAHTTDETRWVVLYVKRWLAAPLQLPDGTLQDRDRGTPEGSAISPVLANLFMHYAFDAWLTREYSGVQFERCADDAVVHCVTKRQADRLVVAIADRMGQLGLQLHPTKTKIVYCKDSNRRDSYEHTSFTFLGFTFRPPRARRKDGMRFTAFLPAISKEALKKISAEIRSSRLHRWVRYKKWRTWKKAIRVLMEAAAKRPRYFAHWAWVNRRSDDQDDKSRMTGRLSPTDLWEPGGAILPGHPTEFRTLPDLWRGSRGPSVSR
ncbi:reverse transcriptase domain-containing protein [Leekyejoonella antrihumi]|uniref:reverse transcriptase domain-containing protein n=1 Tax=Leekyejoonella antrihumi TaxID=1660198 RepID=UPI001C97674B|nr:reverse transcriptase domain-containing protein [Leekyejoonella antrihumi]